MNASLRSWVAPSLAVLALSGAGCENKPTAVVQDAGVSDSGPPKPILGGKLGAAVAAAESAQAAPPSRADGVNGPPSTGVFPPGAADVAHPAGAPAKLELLGEGSEPKVLLSPSFKGDQRGLLTVGLRVGPPPQVLPTIDYGLSLKMDKPKAKGDKAKDDKSKDDSEKPGPIPLLVTVTSATPAREQLDQLSKEMVDVIGKLKGSEIRCQLTPEGSLTSTSVTPSKDAEQGLIFSLQALAEALTVMTAPLPQKPVGVGAYWMVTDRNASLGAEVIRYRVFKVDKIEQGHAKLSLDTREYAVKDEFDLGTATKGAIEMQEFEFQGKGSLAWDAGAILPPIGQLFHRLRVQAGVPGGPKGGPVRLLQLETTAKSGEPDKAEKK